jgi:predicted dehydrogenase
MNSTAKKIRLGLVGLGNWAQNGHLAVLKLLPQFETTAVYSQRPGAARAAADAHGIRHVAATLDELVNFPEVDLVLVLTTAQQHEEAIRAAVAAGKDVYCEWPLTPKAETTAELVELARKARVKTIVGLQRRFAPAFRYLRDLVADGYVGKLRSVKIQVSTPAFGNPLPEALRWSVFPENFMDVTSIFGAHLLDPLFSVVGRPKSFTALLDNQFAEVTVAGTGEKLSTSVPHQLLLSGKLTNGAVFSAHIEGGKRNGFGVQIDITGEAGDLHMSNPSAFGNSDEHYVISGAKGEESQRLAPLPVPDSYRQVPESPLWTGVLELADLYVEYARDLQNGTQTVPSFADALWMQRLLEQASLASQAGARVTLRD